MKNSVKIIGIVLIAVSLVCCGQSKKEPEVITVDQQLESNEKTSKTIKNLNAVSKIAQAGFKDSNITNLYSGYLALKKTLVNGNSGEARARAAMIQGFYKKLTNAPEGIQVAATAIASNNEIVKQREAFETLTKEMEPLLAEAINSGAIYKQFCPMAFDGLGAFWFSNSEEIRNPYFGDKMLKCGFVKETFK